MFVQLCKRYLLQREDQAVGAQAASYQLIDNPVVALTTLADLRQLRCRSVKSQSRVAIESCISETASNDHAA